MINLPFNTDYLPDMIFHVAEPINPNIYNYMSENANLVIRPILFNLAHECWLIDNYCIQFGGNGKIYIQDLMNRSYVEYETSLFTDKHKEWIRCGTNASVLIQRAMNTNSEFSYESKLFYTIMYYSQRFILNSDQRAEYEYALNKFTTIYSNLELKNNQWYMSGEKITWGYIGLFMVKQLNVYNDSPKPSENAKASQNINGDFIEFVKGIPSNQLREFIRYEYDKLRNRYIFGIKLGENGSIEFVAALLLYKYQYKINNEMGADACEEVIHKAFTQELSPLQFSDTMDVVVNRYSSIHYEEWSEVYRYLKFNHRKLINEFNFVRPSGYIR